MQDVYIVVNIIKIVIVINLIFDVFLDVLKYNFSFIELYNMYRNVYMIMIS